MGNPIHANFDSRPAIDVLGDRYTLLFSSEETGGSYALLEFEIQKGRGSPPHIHSREDESFYVLSGAVDFMLDGKTVHAKAGDVVFGPRGISHNFTGASDVPARMICLVSPGGFEKFLVAAGTPVVDRDQPPPEPTEQAIQHLLKIAPEFGLTML